MTPQVGGSTTYALDLGVAPATGPLIGSSMRIERPGVVADV
jgi:hypothetical protein